MLETLLVAGLQVLEPVPELAETGTTVQVRALDGTGHPLQGLPVEVLTPEGTVARLGVTGADGTVEFAAEMPGEHLFRAELPTPDGPPVRLWAPYRVVSSPRRWLYALACVPLGLVLLWVNLKRLRPGPSPRDP